MFLQNKIVFAVWVIVGVSLAILTALSSFKQLGKKKYLAIWITTVLWWLLGLLDELLFFLK